MIRDDWKGLSKWMRPRAQLLFRVLRSHGFTVTLYSGKRSRKEQAIIVARGDSTVMQSKHLTGDAMDLVIEPDLDRMAYRYAGSVWTALGGKWGGNFKNAQLAAVEFQHYEKP